MQSNELFVQNSVWTTKFFRHQIESLTLFLKTKVKQSFVAVSFIPSFRVIDS